MPGLENYKAKSGRLEPVFTIEVQTLAEDVDKILDAIMSVHPLSFGKYQRNASVTAQGYETAQPEAGSTTVSHKKGYSPGQRESYPVVELKVSIERDVEALALVMDQILEVHHYEEPVIFVSETWASRSNYDPASNNPNRWWNNGRGMPNQLD